MSYNKTEWKSGDVITAEKLNNLENGMAAANPFLLTIKDVDMSSNPMTCVFNEKWSELQEANERNSFIMCDFSDYFLGGKSLALFWQVTENAAFAITRTNAGLCTIEAQLEDGEDANSLIEAEITFETA